MSKPPPAPPRRVVVVGGGFGGLLCAIKLAGQRGVDVTLIDRRNHHLFQPLLYQVAMAGLSPAEIAYPIRTIFSGKRNVQVLLGRAVSVDLARKQLRTDDGEIPYDNLVLACGARHSYFGHDEWEVYAPGLKSLEEATEIRRRVLTSFELAEKEKDPVRQHKLLTFIVIGGGPTGVELAGALGEISRYTLSKDFRHIDPRRTRVILIEAGPRILPTFDASLSERATTDLESLGVTVWTSTAVTQIDADGVDLNNGETLQAATILWAAGVAPAAINETLGVPLDRSKRVIVETDCSLKSHPEVFVIGDMAHFPSRPSGPERPSRPSEPQPSGPENPSRPLPGLAPVAMQQGRHVARLILGELKGKPRVPFKYLDKGQMATIGRRRAIVEFGRLKFGGFIAWLGWLFIHILYLIGFKNRLAVLLNWGWNYFSFTRGARLIVGKDWRTASTNSPAPRDVVNPEGPPAPAPPPASAPSSAPAQV